MKRECEDYHSYVFRNGTFIGDFESMYQNCDDPWEQSSRENDRTEKNIAIQLLKRYNCKSVVEIGCGKGYFTNILHQHDFDVTGIDISPTAIQKAKEKFPNIKFKVGDILDFDIYGIAKQQCILLSEVTWYILDKLQDFLTFYNTTQNIYLLHLLSFYAPGRQKYGTEYFTNIDSMLKYFNLDYMEYGQIYKNSDNGDYRTYFMALPKKLKRNLP